MSFRLPLPFGRLAGVGFVSLVAVFCTCPQAAHSQDLTIRTLSAGQSKKVCQLTGERDWATGALNSAQTQQSGLTGTDLGYPVEHNGQVALLFGDTRTTPPRNSDEIGPPDDAVGWITSRTPPTVERCTDLRLNTERADSSRLVSPTIKTAGKTNPASLPIKQGLFNVPSGGVSSDGSLYAFFWTDHCKETKSCPESETLNSVGRGVLARSSDRGVTFVDAVPMPRGFVYTTAANAVRSLETNISGDRRLGIFVFGVPSYRASGPYLAYAPPGKMGDPSAWAFFVGLRPDGEPSWTSYEVWQRGQGGQWKPPGHPELLSASDADQCVGEHSVTWNHALDVWLLLYNCGPPSSAKIVARIAATPWGPWSDPKIILDADRDGSWCKLLFRHGDGACLGRTDDWKESKESQDGTFYAPFVIERFTTPEPSTLPSMREATIHWLVSTWNPYQVVVMQTRLRVHAVRIGIGSRGPSEVDTRGRTP